MPLYLGQAAELFPEVQRAADETGSAAFEPISVHLHKLSNCIFPQQHAFQAAAENVRPDGHAMQLLAALSFALHNTASEGEIPDDEELEKLQADVRDLVSEVADSGLPPLVKRALLHRLSEILEALDHLDARGPEAVRRAAEALAATAVIYGEDADDGDATTMDKIKKYAKWAWVVFSAGTVFTTAPLGWDRLVHPDKLLNPAAEQKALPSGDAQSQDDGPPRPS